MRISQNSPAWAPSEISRPLSARPTPVATANRPVSPSAVSGSADIAAMTKPPTSSVATSQSSGSSAVSSAVGCSACTRRRPTSRIIATCTAANSRSSASGWRLQWRRMMSSQLMKTCSVRTAASSGEAAGAAGAGRQSTVQRWKSSPMRWRVPVVMLPPPGCGRSPCWLNSR